ncbi:hypothetical protein VPH35_097296 [Triticum aestivum]
MPPPPSRHFSPLPFLASPDSAPLAPGIPAPRVACSSACTRPWRGGARGFSDRPVRRLLVRHKPDLL